jgi:hypothetical protein
VLFLRSNWGFNGLELKIIKMVIREIGWDDMDCISLAQDRDKWMALLKTVMNLRVP